MDSIAEMERKKALVAEREEQLSELKMLKQNASIDSLEKIPAFTCGLQKAQSLIHNKAHRDSKRFSAIRNATEMKKAFQKRSETVKVVPFHRGHFN